MNKDILTAALLSDESESLLIVEPFDHTLCQLNSPPERLY